MCNGDGPSNRDQLASSQAGDDSLDPDVEWRQSIKRVKLLLGSKM